VLLLLESGWQQKSENSGHFTIWYTQNLPLRNPDNGLELTRCYQ